MTSPTKEMIDALFGSCDPERIIENDDEWVRAEDALTFVMIETEDTLDGVAASLRKQQMATARVNAGGTPETFYLAVCEKAGIPTMVKPYWKGGRTGFDDHYIPTWAAIFIEATIARSAQQTRVLARIARDEEYRNAGVAIWRLSGLSALATWIDSETKGTDQ